MSAPASLARPHVALTSLSAPDYIGGLAGVQRALADCLKEDGWSGEFVSISPEFSMLPAVERGAVALNWPATSVRPRPTWVSRRRLYGWLGARPRLHWLLARFLASALPPAELLRQQRPQVVHYAGTGWEFACFPFLRAARRAGARFVVCPGIHPNSWGDSALDFFLYRQADAITCFTEAEAAFLARHGVERRRIFVCGLPAMCRTDGERDRFRASHQLGDAPVVLFMGRREPTKGFDALLQAWPEVLRRHPQARLVLIAKPAATPTQLPPQTLDLGSVSEQTKADALAACDVFCLPSDFESFGIVFIEAWTYGKPVICGSAASSREVVRDSRDGLWGDSNPGVLVPLLDALLADPAKARAYGASGQRRAGETFSRAHFLQANRRALLPDLTGATASPFS